MATRAFKARWTGATFEPLPRFVEQISGRYKPGDVYRLVEEDERSIETHNHQFAEIREAWLNLPERLKERFPTPTRLRKFALIRCGYATHREFVAENRAEAIRLAAFLNRDDDEEYTLVSVQGSVVHEFKPMSQKKSEMGAKLFQESKSAVLDYVASLIGVSRHDLDRNAGRAA